MIKEVDVDGDGRIDFYGMYQYWLTNILKGIQTYNLFGLLHFFCIRRLGNILIKQKLIFFN